MAAGTSLEYLDKLSQADLPIIRIMPNLNAKILQSSTAICRNDKVSDQLFAIAKQITDSFGTTFEIAEKDFDTFTALAGSSPAYIALFIEAMSKAGLKHGFPKDLAFKIVSQTVLATTSNLIQGQEKPNPSFENKPVSYPVITEVKDPALRMLLILHARQVVAESISRKQEKEKLNTLWEE